MDQPVAAYFENTFGRSSYVDHKRKPKKAIITASSRILFILFGIAIIEIFIWPSCLSIAVVDKKINHTITITVTSSTHMSPRVPFSTNLSKILMLNKQIMNKNPGTRTNNLIKFGRFLSVFFINGSNRNYINFSIKMKVHVNIEI